MPQEGSAPVLCRETSAIPLLPRLYVNPYSGVGIYRHLGFTSTKNIFNKICRFGLPVDGASIAYPRLRSIDW
jgi:hypothetical protein